MDISLRSVAIVHNYRTETKDDYWGNIISTIELDPSQFSEESIFGLDSFSHLEIIFFMHLVSPEKINTKARSPRNRDDFPRVGIFAQRAKGRPNCLGVSRCQLLKVEGLKLTVQGLDAINSTPVLDIKPYLSEFGPRGEVRQPDWTRDIMSHYYDLE